MPEVIRGLTVAAAAPEATITPVESPFSYIERADLAVATLESLGLVSDNAAATEHIVEHMQNLHDALRTAKGNGPAVEVEPFFAIELSDQFGLKALLKAYDTRQEYDSYVYNALWDQYSPAELNARKVGETAVAASGNDVQGGARAMLLGGGHSEESGLYHTGKNAKAQIKAVTGNGLINPADYIMLNAQRREAGQDPLDMRTFTRFVQLEKKRAGGSSWAALASWVDVRLGLGRSAGGAYSFLGVRFSVGPESFEF